MDWRDCIVIYIDLVGIRKRARNPNSDASLMMRTFHKLVEKEMQFGLPCLHHAYVWNDSLLLLGYISASSVAYQNCLQDADTLKREIDKSARSYAIAVKGQAFPLPAGAVASRGRCGPERVTILRTSSYAMANCFEIEKEIKKRRLRKSWYVDERIVKKIKAVTSCGAFELKPLPHRQPRKIYLFDGNLYS